MTPDIKWQCADFDEFSGKQIYAILRARCQVFAIEQHCIYQDMDNHDLTALHVIGWAEKNQVAAYLRLLTPNTHYPEPSIGRVLTTSAFRGHGVGKRLMAEGIKQLTEHYPNQPVRINAQTYLVEFYRAFGFEVVSKEYMEYDIPHIEMLRSAQ